mgnify:CR=1 FL=1
MSLLIFQQTGHLLPVALFVFTITSPVSDCSIIANDVIHNSEKSILSAISYKFLFNFIVKLASRLEPISLLALSLQC